MAHAQKFRLSPKRTSPFKSAGASLQSTAGSRGVRISVSNAGYTTFRCSVRVLATHSIRQFPLHFPSRATPCAIRFQKHSTRFNLDPCLPSSILSGVPTDAGNRYSPLQKDYIAMSIIRPTETCHRRGCLIKAVLRV
jgi:hypothetical protein